jgi:hypothetical protein
MFLNNTSLPSSGRSGCPEDGGNMFLNWYVSTRTPQHESLLPFSGHKRFTLYLTLFAFRPNSDLNLSIPSIRS